MAVHLESSISAFDWGAETVRVGDLDGYGAPDLKEILVYERGAGQAMAIYDGWGEMLDTLEVPPEICGVYHGNPGIHIAYRADVWGDSREEVLVAGWKGLRIYANRRRLAFYGGLDKHVLRRSPEEITRELEAKIPPLVKSGGCVLALDHRIPNGTPLEHYRFYIAKVWETLEREGVALG